MDVFFTLGANLVLLSASLAVSYNPGKQEESHPDSYVKVEVKGVLEAKGTAQTDWRTVTRT